MSRAWVHTCFLLFILCGASAFALRAMREPDAVVAPPADADAAPSIASAAAEVLADRLADRPERIDARLAALSAERRAPPPQAAMPEMPPAEAERRLARLLPGDVVDLRQFARFQMDIAELPQAERFALSAALMRAMNQDRIRVRQ